MEQWVNRTPYFPASRSQENNSGKPENTSETPENNSGSTTRRNGFMEFHPRSPRNSRPLYTDQASLESLFGGLSLQGGDRQHTLSFGVPQVDSTADLLDTTDEFVRAQKRYNNNAEFQGFIRSQNGINGAHQNLSVGPEIRGDLFMNLPVAYAAQQLCNPPEQFCSEDDRWRCNYEVANCNGYSVGPFLPSTASLLHREPTGQFPILSVSNLVDYSYMNSLVPRNLNFGVPNLKDNQELNRWNQPSALMGGNELRGKVVALAKDQHGSKMLQAKLEKGNNEEIETVLREMIDYVGDLMKNQSGSYVIQKLFVVCNEEQRTVIIQAITRNTHQFIGICFSQHGARAMQKLLDNLSTPQQRSLILSAITPVAVALANDQSGQHVIQFCVKTFSIEYTRHLLNEIANNCFAIATQKSGCCVLQSCVESARGELRDRLIAEILANAVQLSEDQYGNYVVQHLVGLKLPRVTETLLDRLQGNFVTLSCNKYASNVVEKIFLESGEEHSRRIITELLRSSSASMLLVDPYGNFVIQTALQIAKGHVFNALYKLVCMNAASMQSNLYGKKILDRLFSRKEPLHCTRFYKRQV
ncbi:hypothetical protein HAX54_023136 [Datura stramonium]|uniref:PUM-HD domain-containing protein n=1 Tax=Datura stramonium TaxID=4076 RepID=A0ABS8S4E7_DATST|nr:hypothetical protein [Datura stramonium]